MRKLDNLKVEERMDIEKKVVAEYKSTGKSPKDLSIDFDISHQAVNTILKAAGVKMPKKSRKRVDIDEQLFQTYKTLESQSIDNELAKKEQQIEEIKKEIEELKKSKKGRAEKLKGLRAVIGDEKFKELEAKQSSQK